ncbi:MAG TPA: hypothetical protein VN958_14370 [Chitinophagaceae bacterium]|nr:hypothetical protein [Chitinophagaceae bacterium]
MLTHISSKDKYFLKFRNAIHEIFSSLQIIAKAVDSKLENIDSGRHEIICNLTLTFFDQYLKQSRTASTKEYIDQLVKNKSTVFDTAYPEK